MSAVTWPASQARVQVKVGGMRCSFCVHNIAIESSDVIIVSHRLGRVGDAFDVARDSDGRTKQNLTIAFAFNGIGVPLATTGGVHPGWAMAAMATSVSIVLLNSFGLRARSPAVWRGFANPSTASGEAAGDRPRSPQEERAT